MDWLIGGAFALGTVVLIVVIYVWCERSVAGKRDAYARLAAKYGGSYESPGWFALGSLRLPWQGNTIHVSNWSEGGEAGTAYTRIQADFPDRSLHLDVERFDLLTGLIQSLGLAGSCSTGLKSFDDLYRVSSNDCPRAVAYLTPPIMQAIEEIRALAPSSPFCVSISGGGMEMNLGMLLEEFEPLARYVELATRLLAAPPAAKPIA